MDRIEGERIGREGVSSQQRRRRGQRGRTPYTQRESGGSTQQQHGACRTCSGPAGNRRSAGCTPRRRFARPHRRRRRGHRLAGPRKRRWWRASLREVWRATRDDGDRRHNKVAGGSLMSGWVRHGRGGGLHRCKDSLLTSCFPPPPKWLFLAFPQ